MTTKYNIGTLNENKLTSPIPTGLGFTLVDNDITLQNCINNVRGSELPNLQSRYVAIPANARESTPGNPLSLKGRCYKGSAYDPINNPDDTTGTLFDLYSIPPNGPCNDINSCLKDNSLAKLNQEKIKVQQLIDNTNIELKDVKIRIWAINNQKDYATAEQNYNNDIEKGKLTAQLAELNKKKEALEAHKLSLSARNSEASILLSDKNRLLATVNSNIQQKYTKLEDVNNKINTITQDIYTNNLEMKQKENIIQTLKVIIAIVILMAVVLMIYFGMEYVESNYPDALTNIVNKFNNNNNLNS